MGCDAGRNCLLRRWEVASTEERRQSSTRSEGKGRPRVALNGFEREEDRWPGRGDHRVIGLRRSVTTAAHHRCNGTRPHGRRAVLARCPHYRPESVKRSPPPEVHAATAAARKAFLAALKIFLLAYHTASERFRAGDLTVELPEEAFRPHGSYFKPRGASVAA